MRRDQPILRNCWVCGEPLPLSKGSRHRLTCSDRCRSTRRRRLKGQMSWAWKRRKKETDRERALPLVERPFDPDRAVPILAISFRRNLYECLACGKPYIVERILSGNKASPYCSPTCYQRATDKWTQFRTALDRVYYAGEKVHPRVLARLEHHKLSPLCPRCKKPFPPRTWMDGRRRGGRPRKYCSDACRKKAYEIRWRTNHCWRARRHRFRDCAECGKHFSRVDSRGRAIMKYCSEECSNRMKLKAYYYRNKARAKGQKEFKYGASGYGTAARRAAKNKRQEEEGIGSDPLYFGSGQPRRDTV